MRIFWCVRVLFFFLCMLCVCVCLCVCLPVAEMASSKLQQDQMQREVKQLQALAAEKDGRLADAAGEAERLRQQLGRLQEQLQHQGRRRV